jgi:cytochrome c556
MNRGSLVVLTSVVLVGGLVAGLAWADHDHDLPAGPIRDRHELMEGIGDAAKKIGEAAKANDAAAMIEPATDVAERAAKIAALFPPGSLGPKSRAKPEIWERFDEFESDATALQQAAAALATTAKAGGALQPAVEKVMGSCKTCHQAFRRPKKKEGK